MLLGWNIQQNLFTIFYYGLEQMWSLVSTFLNWDIIKGAIVFYFSLAAVSYVISVVRRGVS